MTTQLSIRTEFLEAVEVTANLFSNPGNLAFESYQVAVEWTDVVAAVVASFDDVNREADAARVKTELTRAIQELQARIELPFWAAGVLPLLGPMLVDQLAAFSGSVEEFKRQRLLPFFQNVEEFGRRSREMLQQLPPPPAPTPKAA